MNLRKKLIIQYVRQFSGFVMVLLVCFLVTLGVLGTKLLHEDIEVDLSRLTASDIEFQLIYDGESIRVEKRVEKSVESHQGWLQILDDQGNVIYAYRSPAGIPIRYTPGEWKAMVQSKQYHVKHWVVEQSDRKVIVLYGRPAPEEELMSLLQAAESSGSAEATKALQETFLQKKAWYAIYDREGRLLQEWNHPTAAPKLELIEVLEKEEAPSYTMSRFDEQSHRMYLVGTQYPVDQPGTADESFDNMMKTMLLQFGLIMIASVVIAGSWYALRVGKPLLHMVTWLEHLAKGDYDEPVGRKGRSVGKTRKGKYKRSFAVFKDMFDALSRLSQTLQTNEQRQKDVERTREEWITGLSHDLKTPLSSIFGYASILESEQYKWEHGEVSQFGRTIREKADYMNGLIEDLTLTYRLKNQALPMMKTEIPAVETIRRITVEMVNDPIASEHQIEFRTSVSSLNAEVDPTYFRRIIINILANAIKHTPAGTLVLVELSSYGNGGFQVKVRDNGPGMDQDTLANLFERYYRGGHTEENESGTGLGMAIAKQLVLAHEGEITVESELGYGTTVTLTFGYNRTPANGTQ